MERAEYVVACRSIIFDDNNRVLLVQRAHDDNHNPLKWEFPGGKPKPGIRLEVGRRDEVFEETGLHTEPISSLSFIDDRLIEEGKYAGSLHIAVFGLARVIGGELVLSHEHVSSAWEHYGEALGYDLTSQSRKALLALSGTLMKGIITP